MRESEMLNKAKRFAVDIFVAGLGSADEEDDLMKIVETSLAFAILEFAVLLSKEPASTITAREITKQVSTYFEEP